ncbi:MAG TPA: PAS-domain containing protein [Bauldia sp.]|nr:PAS-domain containing protein [Bauldia sp.]
MREHGGNAIAIRRAGLTVLLVAASTPSLTLAASSDHLTAAGALDLSQVVLMAALVGAFVFVILSTIQLVRARGKSEQENARLRLEIGDLKSFSDRAEALVNEEDQRLVAWGAPGDPPLVAGSLPRGADAPQDRAAFLNFEGWLQPESAVRLIQALTLLRENGEHFQQVIATQGSRLIEVRGRTVGGSAVARFRDLTGERLARAEIEARHDLLAAEIVAMRAMLAAAPMPIWLRDKKGALVWANAAYAAAVEAKDNTEAVAHGLELLDTNSRGVIAAAHADSPVFTKRLSAIVAGARRIFDVADIVSEGGSAGIAVDVTEVEAAQAALRREVDFNARTLDRLQTAVAVFGPDRRLKSYNAAYRALFELDPAFLESAPDESAILDRLRAARKLPEQADFRSWRADLFAAYRSTDPREQWWHMPDGQTLRVIASPHPQGGATWVYENVTERLDLESRYNALVSVQGETLDHLAEGVGVFGSDGRLRLHNPAFAAIWRLDAAFLDSRPHVTDIVSAFRKPGDDEAMWRRFTACVAGLDETRASISGRMERPDGRIVDYATVPLPDGQTMVTFLDVTDSVQVERALVERNEALEASDSLKNAFIHHVSYELRSPLTNIIGFTQLLSDVRLGPLNERQREYTGYVMSSSAQLLAIVNDILDLTTIDAGIMGLDLAEVDVAATVHGAVDDVQAKLDENRIKLDMRIAPDVGGLVADAKRVRQILFNLLANAVAFSREGGRVQLSANRVGGFIEFNVADEGAGIPAAFIDSVFDRFASLSRGAARGGVGLGLSIVKSFVALHGGTVEIASEEGKGTTAKVRLPVRPALDETVAA